MVKKYNRTPCSLEWREINKFNYKNRSKSTNKPWNYLVKFFIKNYIVKMIQTPLSKGRQIKI